MNTDNISQDDWILGGLALLLAIALLFFPWFDISVGPFSATFTATGTPDGWLGVLGMIAAIAVLVDLGIERLSPQTQVPAIGGSRAMTRFVLAAIAAGFTALKFLFHIHFSLFGWGFYASVIIAGALVFYAMRARQAPVSTGAASPPPPPPSASAGPGESAGPPGSA
jgi:hypothetical protein